MDIILRNIQYHPNGESVALLIEHELGSFFVNTTQDALTALTPGGTGVWSDAEALTAAQAGVDERFPASSYTVVLPEPEVPT